MFGTPESELALSLREIESDGLDIDQLEVTTCLRKGEVEIDVRYRDDAVGDRREPARGTQEAPREHPLQPRRHDDRRDRRGAARRAASLGLAESCSAGLLAARITDIPGASEYFAGGVVSYSNEAKHDLLGVDEALLEEFGAVSPEVAKAMAEGALERFDADVALSITGIAGPGGGTDEKPVGFVCFHAMTSDGAESALSPVIPGGRSDIRERSRWSRCTCCGACWADRARVRSRPP